jgi:hypothetical protein
LTACTNLRAVQFSIVPNSLPRARTVIQDALPLVTKAVSYITVGLQLLGDTPSRATKFIDDWALETNWQPARRALAACTRLESIAFVLQRRWDSDQPVESVHPGVMQKFRERVAQQLPEMYSAGKLRFPIVQ